MHSKKALSVGPIEVLPFPPSIAVSHWASCAGLTAGHVCVCVCEHGEKVTEILV